MEAKLVEERKKRVLIEDECRRLTEQNEQVQHNSVCVCVEIELCLDSYRKSL